LVDGSNESLYHPDEESDPILRKGIPLQKNVKIIDVTTKPGFVDTTTLPTTPPLQQTQSCSKRGKAVRQ